MADVLETASGPIHLEGDVDPVNLDLIENGLRNARTEMDEVLFRTALSPGIREQHDEFPLIADRHGKMVVGQFGLSIPALLDGFEGTIEEGDILLTSDPYACDGAISHANDWLVVAPIYFSGRHVGWTAMFGHMSDVGGKAPSSMPTDAITIFEEGVVIPPIKLYQAGELNADALSVILNQVRKPDWNRADLNGLVAACRTGAKRIEEMCERFGTATYLSALDALLERNYQAMKTLLDELFADNSKTTFVDYICDDGVGFGPYRLVLSAYREDDLVVLDFDGSDDQAVGPINYLVNENLVKMFFGVYLITVADPQIVWNDGFYPLLKVRIPEGSFWKPQRPAALNARNHGIGRLFDLFSGVLGQKRPELLTGAGFSSSPHFMYAGNYSSGSRQGEWFQLYSIGFGGIPGRPAGDGPDGHSLWPSFVNVPCEYLEANFPILIERMETVTDSGGAGLHRGGNGVEVVYKFLEPGTIAIHDDRWLTYPWGVLGGEPGARSSKWIQRADGARESIPSKVHGFSVGAGDVLHFVTWGGGGWGDPLDRDPELVALEVMRGLISTDGARRYGVVLGPGGAVNVDATDRYRAELRTNRVGPPATFDRGPDLRQVLERALQETGLHAPRPPGSSMPTERSGQHVNSDEERDHDTCSSVDPRSSPVVLAAATSLPRYRVRRRDPQAVNLSRRQPAVKPRIVGEDEPKSAARATDSENTGESIPPLHDFPLTLRAWTPQGTPVDKNAGR